MEDRTEILFSKPRSKEIQVCTCNRCEGHFTYTAEKSCPTWCKACAEYLRNN